MVTDLQHPCEDGTQLPRWRSAATPSIRCLPLLGCEALRRVCGVWEGSALSTGIHYGTHWHRVFRGCRTAGRGIETAAVKECHLDSRRHPSLAWTTVNLPSLGSGVPCSQPQALQSRWISVDAAGPAFPWLCSVGMSITVTSWPQPLAPAQPHGSVLGLLLLFSCYKCIPFLTYLLRNELHKQNSFMQSSFYFPAFIPICIYFCYNRSSPYMAHLILPDLWYRGREKVLCEHSILMLCYTELQHFKVH